MHVNACRRTEEEYETKITTPRDTFICGLCFAKHCYVEKKLFTNYKLGTLLCYLLPVWQDELAKFGTCKVRNFQSSQLAKFSTCKVLNLQSSQLTKFSTCKVLNLQSSQLAKFSTCKVLNLQSSQLAKFSTCKVLNLPGQDMKTWSALLKRTIVECS
jgi:hypothetical protein